jgi:hypothetical protein
MGRLILRVPFWWSNRNPHGGKARVYLDGVLIGKVNLYRTRPLSGVAVYTSPSLTRGPHKLAVKLVHSKRVTMDDFRDPLVERPQMSGREATDVRSRGLRCPIRAVEIPGVVDIYPLSAHLFARSARHLRPLDRTSSPGRRDICARSTAHLRPFGCTFAPGRQGAAQGEPGWRTKSAIEVATASGACSAR